MAYIRFKDSEEFISAVVKPVDNHVVRITGDVKPNTDGFKLYLRDNDKYPLDNGEYEAYTTLYREGEGWFELSDDGSIYVKEEVAPVQPSEPYVPTLDEVKSKKVAEMNNTQQMVIQNGINVTLSDGTIEHFTLTDHDQTSLMGLQTQVVAGAEQIPWHTSDTMEHCKYYSNEDMRLITQAAMQFVAYHVTYFRDLRIYINSLDVIEEVDAVYYGISIPDEYQSEPLKDMLAQMQ